MLQALGMLFWHKHNVDRALTDLANFTPFPDEWTVEDKVLFEQAFSFHGKSFHRIRQMVSTTQERSNVTAVSSDRTKLRADVWQLCLLTSDRRAESRLLYMKLTKNVNELSLCAVLRL